MIETMDDSDPGSPGSRFSVLSRSLDRGLQLPNLSPLSDRDAFRPNAAAEHIGRELHSQGFDVGWNHGRYEISPSASMRPASVDNLLALSKGGFRPRTPSFLKWTTLKNKQGLIDEDSVINRPRTAPEFQTTYNQAFHSLRPSARPSSWAATARRRDFHQCKGPPASTAMQVPNGMPGPPAAMAMQVPHGLPDLTIPDQRPGTSYGSAQLPLSPPSAAVPLLGEPVLAVASSNDEDKLNVLKSQRKRNPMPMTISIPDCQPSGVPEKPGTARPSSRAGQLRATNRGPVDNSKSFKQVGQASSHPMAQWRPTRGHALVVFNEMDKDKNGKITKSEFEEAAVSLGFSDTQAEKMFNKLDVKRKGYLVSGDWGRKDFVKVVEAFTLMYMQKHLGLPDITATDEQVKRYFYIMETRKVKSLPAAINLVRVNAITRGANVASGSGNAMYDAFRFIDSDGSGNLSKEELRDAFFGLGVYLNDDVAEQIMTVFDKDGNGSVNYFEFARAMFGKTLK